MQKRHALRRRNILARMTSLSSLTATPPLESALLREDGRVAYPIRDGIPLLIVDEQLILT